MPRICECSILAPGLRVFICRKVVVHHKLLRRQRLILRHWLKADPFRRQMHDGKRLFAKAQIIIAEIVSRARHFLALDQRLIAAGPSAPIGRTPSACARG